MLGRGVTILFLRRGLLLLLACLCLGPGGLKAQEDYFTLVKLYPDQDAKGYLGLDLTSGDRFVPSPEAGFYDDYSLYSVTYVNIPWQARHSVDLKGRLVQKRLAIYPFHKKLFFGLGLLYQQEDYQETLDLPFVNSAKETSLVRGDFRLKRSGFCVFSYLRPAGGFGVNLCSFPFIQSSDYSFDLVSNPGQVSPQRIAQAVAEEAEEANQILDSALLQLSFGFSF